MAIDTSVPRTRRALLAGGIGGLAALVASALGRPLRASAANGDPIYLGSTDNKSTAQTLISHSGNGNAFTVVSTAFSATALTATCWDQTSSTTGVASTVLSPHGIAVYATSTATSGETFGVWARDNSSAGTAVDGASLSSGVGVRGGSATGDGVVGASDGSSKSGVYGYSTHGNGFGVFGRNKPYGATGALGAGIIGVRGTSPAASGVVGSSGSATPPASAETGVHGYAIQGASARGVHGQSTIGTGVRGAATSGTGGYFTATTGTALRAVGRVKLDKASGVATIAATTTSATVTPGLDVTSASFVLLTPKADLGSRRLWYTTDATNNRFTIRVSSAVPANLHVGWLLLG